MNDSSRSPSFPARAVGALAAAAAAVVWTHALAGACRLLDSPDAPVPAVALTLFALALPFVALLPRGGARTRGVLASAAGTATLLAAAPETWAAVLSLLVAVPFAVAGGDLLARRLPHELGDLARRRPRSALLWSLLALLAIVQVSRLSSWINDPEIDWFLSTRDPFWADHECLPAYLHGAELADRGESPYDPIHYPALVRDAEPETGLRGMTVEDPFQYPPPFLLLPKIGLALTDDYAAIRSVWFGLNTTLVLGVAALSAVWMGGASGRLALWLLPLFAASFPTLHDLQFGQFHLAAIALSVAGLVAFRARRPRLGGGLLALAILSKVFPGVLLVPLAVRRRWKELAWTAAWGAVLTMLSLGLLGPAPFEAFVVDQLPRLSSGAAFAFEEAWPEISDVMVSDNQGAFGMARKLAVLGTPGLVDEMAPAIARLYGLIVLLVAAWIGWLRWPSSREASLATWLGLLGLASMASPGAFGDYVPATACWLAIVVARRWTTTVPRTVLLVATVLFQGLLLGTGPVFEWFEPGVMIPVSAVGVLLLWAVFGRAATERRQEEAISGRVPEPRALSSLA